MAEPSWAQARIEIASAIGMPLAEATRERFERGVHHKLSELLWSVLCTEVVADRLTPEQRLCGRGAWLTGLGPVGELPGPQWRAPKCVIDSVAAVLAGLDAQGLRDVAMRHSDESLEDYRILADRLHGWAMIAPAGCPWRGTLDRLPGVLEARRALRHACGSSGVAALADSVLVRRDELQEWATVMTSAACHRSRLTPAEVAVLTAPFLDLLPELASVVNAYAAAGGG
jgi:hypothetical protein